MEAIFKAVRPSPATILKEAHTALEMQESGNLALDISGAEILAKRLAQVRYFLLHFTSLVILEFPPRYPLFLSFNSTQLSIFLQCISKNGLSADGLAAAAALTKFVCNSGKKRFDLFFLLCIYTTRCVN